MKRIIKKIKSLDGKYRYDELFYDWIRCMAYAISNLSDFKHYDEREAAYKKIVDKHGEHTISIFVKCFAELVNLFDEKGIDDYLGKIYHELNVHNSNKGQFFTPYQLSLASARALVDKNFINSKLVEEDDYVLIGESACGAGSMILAQMQAIKDLGFNYQTTTRVECSDIDENVLLMCYVQLSITGVRARCYVADSLSGEIYSVWQTPALLLLGGYKGFGLLSEDTA